MGVLRELRPNGFGRMVAAGRQACTSKYRSLRLGATSLGLIGLLLVHQILNEGWALIPLGVLIPCLLRWCGDRQRGKYRACLTFLCLVLPKLRPLRSSCGLTIRYLMVQIRYSWMP